MRAILIVSLALLASVAVECYGPRPNRRGPGPPHGGPHGPWGHGPPGPRGPHGPPGRRPPFRPDSFEDSPSSSSCDSDSDSSCSSGSSESGPPPKPRGPSRPQNNKRPVGGAQPCWGWKCSKKTTRSPQTTRPTTPKPTPTRNPGPSSKAWWEDKPSRITTRSTGSWSSTKGWWEDLTPSPTTPSTRPPVTTPSTRQTPPVTTPSTRETPPVTSKIPSTRWTPNTPPDDTTHWGITTPTPEPTTGIVTASTESDCEKRCQSTNEYNPVCGSNGRTYRNMAKLRCAEQCGVKVSMLRTSQCPPSPVGTTATTDDPSRTARTISLTKLDYCTRQCPVTPSFTPVCGTDFVTYFNVDRLNCAKNCGKDVEVLCELPCAVCNQAKFSTPLPTATPSSRMTTPDIGRTTPTVSMEQCLKTCPVSADYKPVCGTNNVNYTNAGHLLCAQMCGDDVRVSRFGPCDPPDNTDSIYVAACIRGCPVTSEYNPVCGSNGVTYNNPSRLECARLCGVRVSQRAERPCPDPLTPEKLPEPTTAPSPPTPEPTTPPYTTAKSTKKPTTAKSTVTTDSSVTDFTIPPEIIKSIWGDEGVVPSTEPTKTTADSEEDFSIDPRFGNDIEEEEYHKEFDNVTPQ